MKRLVRYILIILIAIILLIGGFLGWLTINSYKPQKKEILFSAGNDKTLLKKDRFTILSWNIGYAGLGKEMDFFYEGGKKVRPPEKDFNRYFDGIMNVLGSNDSVDFIFLQEVYRYSKRSYYTDEADKIDEHLKDFRYFFAKNYDSRFVPVPVTDPMGRVVSGLEVLTSFIPDSVFRIDFGTKFSWPKQLAMLQRGFILMRYSLENGKELILINTHNSVFDKDAKLRKKELRMLEDVMNSERAKGNYVIAGGDWNMNPLTDDTSWLHPENGERMRMVLPLPEKDVLEDWNFIFDKSTATNRDVDQAYLKGVTTATIIDFFVVSPNVEAEQIQVLDLGFKYSDHNPVLITLRLKP